MVLIALYRSHGYCVWSNRFLGKIHCQSNGYSTSSSREEQIADLSIARAGCTVVVPYREEMTKRHLKLTGDLGRVVFMVRWNLNREKLTRC